MHSKLWSDEEMKEEIKTGQNLKLQSAFKIWFIIFTFWFQALGVYAERVPFLRTEHRIVKPIQISTGPKRRHKLEPEPTPSSNTLLVWLVKMWNEEPRGGKLFKRVWKERAGTVPTTLWFGPEQEQETVACNATCVSCRPQKIPPSRHTCGVGAKDRQGVQEEEGWSTSKHTGCTSAERTAMHCLMILLRPDLMWSHSLAPGNDCKSLFMIIYKSFTVFRMWKSREIMESYFGKYTNGHSVLNRHHYVHFKSSRMISKV